MANRILVSTEGMKISMPGVNVLTAGKNQLLFDSDFGGITVGARGQYYVGGFGDYYIALPRVFTDTALIMVEAAGHVLGGCRTVGESRHYTGINWFTSRWTISLANTSTLLVRHSNYGSSIIVDPPAGPAFPYILNYAVLDA